LDSQYSRLTGGEGDEGKEEVLGEDVVLGDEEGALGGGEIGMEVVPGKVVGSALEGGVMVVTWGADVGKVVGKDDMMVKVETRRSEIGNDLRSENRRTPRTPS
jgi:hypothetical protein